MWRFIFLFCRHSFLKLFFPSTIFLLSYRLQPLSPSFQSFFVYFTSLTFSSNLIYSVYFLYVMPSTYLLTSKYYSLFCFCFNKIRLCHLLSFPFFFYFFFSFLNLKYFLVSLCWFFNFLRSDFVQNSFFFWNFNNFRFPFKGLFFSFSSTKTAPSVYSFEIPLPPLFFFYSYIFVSISCFPSTIYFELCISYKIFLFNIILSDSKVFFQKSIHIRFVLRNKIYYTERMRKENFSIFFCSLNKSKRYKIKK